MLATLNEVLVTILLVAAIALAVAVLKLLLDVGRGRGAKEAGYAKKPQYISPRESGERLGQAEEKQPAPDSVHSASARVEPRPEEYSWILRLGKKTRSGRREPEQEK